jgi:drug/metabolite transporter (DMT)-like permease
MRMTRTRWFLPLFAAALGGLMLATQWIGGEPILGVVSLAIMCAVGAVFLLGGRSETIRGLRGDGCDERFRQFDVNATAAAGVAVIAAAIVAVLVEFARGRTGEPYTWLAAVGGIAYVAALILQRLRS